MNNTGIARTNENEALVLVLEASTSAAKALLYDSKQGIIAVENEPYSPDFDSGGRQDTEQVYQATLRAGRKAAGGRDVAAVAVGGIWHSITVCDSRMNPVERTHAWTFTKTTDICRSVRKDKAFTEEIYQNTGCYPNVTYAPYVLKYLRENGLTIHDKLLCSQGGYNFFRMTGERLETSCITSGMGILNIHTKQYDEHILGFAGVKAHQFAPLATYRDTRPLTKECADALGIAAGIPVVPAHSDGALNQLGNNAIAPDLMTFSVGTSAAIRLTTEKPVLSDPPATWCYVGVEGYMSGAATAGACNCVNWFKKTVLGDKYSFAELESGLLDNESTPVYLPFPFGERCPGWQDDRLGGFHGLSGGVSAPDMFAGICEGVLFNVYQCYEILTKIMGAPGQIFMSGGILNSPKWTQMAADIFEREITLSQMPQASVLGGAALALHAAGVLSDIRDCKSGGEESIIHPHPEADYSRKYARYLHWYHHTGR